MSDKRFLPLKTRCLDEQNQLFVIMLLGAGLYSPLAGLVGLLVEEENSFSLKQLVLTHYPAPEYAMVNRTPPSNCVNQKP